ncbi:MAG: tRNA (cytidine(34)-2'-O)-methyltransferase [Phycisphaerales bacterium]|nr:tRNA (cytidine(34)-2'-O)-methyltransferase [Phycisphaerales bacterium]
MACQIPFEIVLLQPEIPNNTGNIGRTAVATGAGLHLVHPLGFQMDEKARRRAGLDYWQHLSCREHDSWEAFLEQEGPSRAWLFTSRGGRPYWDADFAPGDHLVFGKESEGVDAATRADFEARFGSDAVLTLPMVPRKGIRSLNLATAVAIAIYEALRQTGGPGQESQSNATDPG